MMKITPHKSESIFIFLYLIMLHFSQIAVAHDHKETISDVEKVAQDAKLLVIGPGYIKNLRWDLPLTLKGLHGSKIVWKSLNPEYLSDAGKLFKSSPRTGKKVKVKMIATLSAGNIRRKKSFEISIAHEEQDYQGYLFTYFEGSGPRQMDEQIRFAASRDAVNWFALNKNLPVIASEEISGTGGIRDPHILRGEDSKHFYMVATDMNTAKNGWAHNPGIVMLKSADLINWKHGFIDLEKTYPVKFKNIQWVWTPQSIYDPEAGKYMVYFTVKYKDDPKLDFYAAYATEDFTAFEKEPTLLFSPKYGAIDGDIIYKDGTYHFFFKGNTKDEQGKEIRNGIQQATAQTLRGPWIEDFKYLDAYSPRKIVVEGSSIFKLNNSDTYILMYDLYTNHRYEFQRSKDLYTFSTTPESFTKNFYPRHGSVMGITAEEGRRLNKKWNGVPESLLKMPEKQINLLKIKIHNYGKS
ncbi:family 43 glycosylhydrolase [Pedobacter sp. N23S346]|uniref:family 43 glycosylhydrolase n=1 Tax=Pedobacter sp. N23S346 TaxID=3402750 RepID=UPI003AC66781